MSRNGTTVRIAVRADRWFRIDLVRTFHVFTRVTAPAAGRMIRRVGPRRPLTQ